MKRFGRYIAIIGEDSARYGDALAEHCADVLLLPPCRSTARPIACHPDTVTAWIGDVLITSAEYAETARDVLDTLLRLADCRVILSHHRHSPAYPGDIGCNVLVWKDFVYGLVPHLWPEIADTARAQDKQLRMVRQGYAGCSALVCSDLVISADPSVLRAVAEDGAQTLAITPGRIELSGYGYGFIGGASGFCEGTAVFFGNPERHPSGAKIRDALEKRGMELLSLADGTLSDCGGIRFLPIREKVSRKDGLDL